MSDEPVAAVQYELTPCTQLQDIKGVAFPKPLSFRQLLVTGPPGSGKSTLIRKVNGWSEEGYVDLARNNWWTAQCLSFRPREIHLGFPFVGHPASFAVFEKDWKDLSPRPELDLSRIQVPPRKRFFFSVNWHARYTFEFMLPPAPLLLQRRLERGRAGSHPVDKDINLALIKDQLRVYRQAAEYLFSQGLTVYLREDVDQPPLKFVVREASS